MDKFEYIEIEQPIGTLYLGKMKVSDILKIAVSKTRTPYNSRGIQRNLDENRAAKIARYAESSDAIFPTPIVLSASSDMVKFSTTYNYFDINTNYEYSCSIVDGQHRLRGIEKAGLQEKYILPVLFLFDTFLEQDAEIFATINGNQKPVSKSLVYDLYGLSNKRTVQKVCHEIIDSLNTDKDSKLSGKIKMLGIKDELNPRASVSQATMIDSLMNYITNDPDRDNHDIQEELPMKDLSKKKYIFREWFIQNKEHVILRVTRNFFNGYVGALEEVYNESNLPIFFNKSIGYMAGFHLIKPIYEYGVEEFKEATPEFYKKILKDILEASKNTLNNTNYGSSASGAKQLYRDLLKVAIEKGIVPKSFVPEVDQSYIEDKKH